jgi:hypothetical protein
MSREDSKRARHRSITLRSGMPSRPATGRDCFCHGHTLAIARMFLQPIPPADEIALRLGAGEEPAGDGRSLFKSSQVRES